MKAELVPNETCAACSANIGPRQTAYLWRNEIVCYRCARKLQSDQNKKEELQRRQAEPASVEQLRFLHDLHAAIPDGLTLGAASKLIDEALVNDRIKHYINGLWLKVKGRHMRDYEIEQEDVLKAAQDLIQERPDVAQAINELLQRYRHSEDFLRASPAALQKQVLAFIDARWNTNILLAKIEEIDKDWKEDEP